MRYLCAMSSPLERDMAAVARISAVPTILRVIAESTGMGYTLVARVTPDRWVACAVHDEISFGLKVGGELEIATTLCREVRDTLQPIVIEHASMEPEFCQHPTPKMYNFESYIAVPVFRDDGSYFGNICALHRDPVKLHGTSAVNMMKLFAELLSLQLQAEEAHALSHSLLTQERQVAELRDQFIAVLGHDLRNPLSAIVSGADLLALGDVPASVNNVASRIRRSAHRMQLLIDDVLDFARGRLGGGISLALRAEDDLERHLHHVVDELTIQYPRREISFSSDTLGTVQCDRARLEQVVSNLLANALQHGSPTERIEVELRRLPETLVINVRNYGAPIPEDVRKGLFQPFRRPSPGHAPSGLGLGLYIVSEVAKAHGGSAKVSSTSDRGTCFTVEIPRTH